jgi:hypothetical protein
MTASDPGPEAASAPADGTSPTASPEPSAPLDPAVLLKAYELAQEHYESDLQLFSARMNLFLLVQSALVTVAGSAIFGSKDGADNYRGAISLFGLALAVAWLFVAVSSYAWVKTWRAQMMDMGTLLKKRTDVVFSSDVFQHGTRSALFDRKTIQTSDPKEALWRLVEVFSWRVRPTLVICCVPLLFIAGWIYLGVQAHWSGI